ncbi:HAD family hydrolase [Trichothermofontia sp.]
MLTALLFDLDGTLANTDPFHFQAWQAYLRTYNLEIDDRFYRQRISGRLNPDIVQDLLPQLTPEQGQQVADEKEAYFRQLATNLTRLPGLTELLNWSGERGLQQAVVTNAPRANVEFTLTVLDLWDHFPTIIFAAELPIGKPDPAPYQLALDKLQVSPAQAIAFEDSASGIRSAVAAGIPTVGVASTHPPSELAAVGASWVINDFRDRQLWDLLGRVE